VTDEYRADMPGFKPGSMLAGYRLEARVGSGGMAVVYRARDERLRRPVALKILAPQFLSDEAFRRRFVGESLAAAAVDDPHIIPVYGAGEADGVLFIAMRFVNGGDLRLLLNRAGVLSPAQAAEVVSPVASALDAAHQAGLVHRDVKPGNVLVDTGPGRPDHVYLSDFGISKSASAVTLTGTGQFFGTPGYSAPEQVEGRNDVDGRADQYALACVTYELLTGETPFQHRNGMMSMLIAHVHEAPPTLTSRSPDLPDAANDVMAKALAKSPGDRYGTCADFADALRDALDLTSYHFHRSPAARPQPRPHEETSVGSVTPPQTPVPAENRTQTMMVSGPTAPPAAAQPAAAPPAADAPIVPADDAPRDKPSPTMTVLSVHQADLLTPSPAEPPAAPDPTMAVESSVPPADTAVAAVSMPPVIDKPEPELPAKLPEPEQPEPELPEPEQPEPELPEPEQPEAGQAEPALPEPEPEPEPEPTPPATLLAGLPTELVQASQPALPNPGTPPLAATLRMREGVDHTVIGQDGTGDVATQVVDRPGTHGDPGPVQPDAGSGKVWRRRLPVLAAGGVLIVAAAGVLPFVLKSPAKSHSPTPPATTASAPTSARATATSSAGAPKFHATALSLPADYQGTPITSLAFSPSDQTLAVAGSGVCLWDLSAGSCTKQFAGSRAVAFSSDGTKLAASGGNGASQDPSLRLVDVPTAKQLAYLPSVNDTGIPSSGVGSVAFSSDDKTVAVGDFDGFIYLWSAVTKTTIKHLQDPIGVNALAFDPQGKLLATGDGSGITYLWNITSGKVTGTLTGIHNSQVASAGVASLAFSPDGKTLAIAEDSGDVHRVYLWNVLTGKLKAIGPLTDPHGTSVTSVAFSHDGATLAVGDGNGFAYLWNTATGKETTSLHDPEGAAIETVAFSAADTVATGDVEGGVYLWSAR
jgi:serine/threonine protein kinase/WD40 repeat protein